MGGCAGVGGMGEGRGGWGGGVISSLRGAMIQLGKPLQKEGDDLAASGHRRAQGTVGIRIGLHSFIVLLSFTPSCVPYRFGLISYPPPYLLSQPLSTNQHPYLPHLLSQVIPPKHLSLSTVMSTCTKQVGWRSAVKRFERGGWGGQIG